MCRAKARSSSGCEAHPGNRRNVLAEVILRCAFVSFTSPFCTDMTTHRLTLALVELPFGMGVYPWLITFTGIESFSIQKGIVYSSDPTEVERRAAIIYSLIESRELNKIDPQRYLHYLLERIADHPITASKTFCIGTY